MAALERASAAAGTGGMTRALAGLALEAGRSRCAARDFDTALLGVSNWLYWISVWEKTDLLRALLAISAADADSAAGALGTAFSFAGGGTAMADTARVVELIYLGDSKDC